MLAGRLPLSDREKSPYEEKCSVASRHSFPERQLARRRNGKALASSSDTETVSYAKKSREVDPPLLTETELYEETA